MKTTPAFLLNLEGLFFSLYHVDVWTSNQIGGILQEDIISLTEYFLEFYKKRSMKYDSF